VPTAPGDYMMTTGTIYHFDGAGLACGFAAWADYVSSGGSPNTTTLPKISIFPQSWKYYGACPSSYLATAQSNNVLAGWPASNAIDGNPSTAYSSGVFPSAANTNSTFLAAWLTGPKSIQTIALRARMSGGQPEAFPISYNISITTPTNSAWTPLGMFSAQPDSNGYVYINLPAPKTTWGVMITPTALGTDSYGNHYFQMADVELLTSPTYSLITAQSNNTFGGWPASNVIDGNMGTDYSSSLFASSANSNGTFLAAWMASPQMVQTVALGARMSNGLPLGFPTSYNLYVTNAANTAWNFEGNFTTQPDASGFAYVNLPSVATTYGVMIIPTAISADSSGSHYFQMAEMQLLGTPNSPSTSIQP
jgi:hypothetical protein